MIHRYAAAALLSALLAFAAACSSPTKPTPIVIVPPTEPPAIMCPAAVAAQTANGAAVVVTYDAPTVAGGATPVTTTCSTASGAMFPLGTTEVSCTAVDGQQRQAACTFAVTVTEVAHISKTSFMAFGDSITEGVDNLSCLVAPSRTGRFDPFDDFRFGQYGFVANPYPKLLHAALAARYPAEMPTVTNRGRSGELVVNGDSRLSLELASMHPQVLLLLEGINDIHLSQGNAVSDIKDAIRSMVKHGKEQSADVFLSTLLPERMGGCKAYDFSDGFDDISDANDAIRFVANEQGVTLVDMYHAFVGQESILLGPDGLHPNQAGYQKMADLFFDAVTTKFDVK